MSKTAETCSNIHCDSCQILTHTSRPIVELKLGLLLLFFSCMTRVSSDPTQCACAPEMLKRLITLTLKFVSLRRSTILGCHTATHYKTCINSLVKSNNLIKRF